MHAYGLRSILIPFVSISPFPSVSYQEEPSRVLYSQLSITRDTFDLGEVPFLVTQRAYTSSFQPSLDTIEMKDMAAITEGDGQSIVVGWARVGLVFNRRFIQTVTANGALNIAIHNVDGGVEMA